MKKFKFSEPHRVIAIFVNAFVSKMQAGWKITKEYLEFIRDFLYHLHTRKISLKINGPCTVIAILLFSSKIQIDNENTWYYEVPALRVRPRCTNSYSCLGVALLEVWWTLKWGFRIDYMKPSFAPLRIVLAMGLVAVVVQCRPRSRINLTLMGSQWIIPNNFY